MPPIDDNRTGTLVATFGSAAARIDAGGPTRAGAWALGALLATVVVFVVWAAVSHMDIVVAGRGRVVPDEPNLVVQPLETSVLRAVEVRPGQVVKAGEVLVRLDPTFADADAGQVGKRLEALAAQIERLERELGLPRSVPAAAQADPDQTRLLAERKAAFDTRSRQLDQTVQRLESALEGNRSDQRILEARLATLRELETMSERLAAEQFITRNRVLENRERRLEAERELRSVTLRENEVLSQVAGAREERASFATEWRSQAMAELARARREWLEQRELRSKADRRAELSLLRAPTDATVLEVGNRSVGSVVREAEPLVTLVRQDSEVRVDADVASADAGFIAAGQPVRIKLDAFPFQKHGVLDGTVLSISSDSLPGTSPADRDARHYVVRVRLDSAPAGAMPKPSAGMTLTAEVVTGTRTVMSYLTYPILRVWDQGLRER